MGKLLEIRNLYIQFENGCDTVRAVNGVNLDICDSEIVALVGESGSGKTVCALSIAGILPANAKISRGQIYFKGNNLLEYSEKKLQALRGKEISYIFQEASASLNPVLTIGEQIRETITLHQNKSAKEAKSIASQLIEMVKLPARENILGSYPHQLSGGMNQRVMIAIALAMRPALLIADEPTTALDVTIEAQIIELILTLRKDFGYAILFITHNLNLAAKIARRIAIMYKGEIAQIGSPDEIFNNPTHKHTAELVNSIIRL